MDDAEKDEKYSTLFPDMEPEAEHLWILADRGSRDDATPKEKTARAVTACLLTAFSELDIAAIKGIVFAIRTFTYDPNDGRDVLRESLGLPISGFQIDQRDDGFYLDGRKIEVDDEIESLTGRGWRKGIFDGRHVWTGPRGEQVGYGPQHIMRWQNSKPSVDDNE
jgi:hypothetical protein